MRVLAGLFEAGVNTLVLKGAALAYTLYPAPHLRPCGDVDLLVKKHHLEEAVAQLEALGYKRLNSISREAVHTQWTFERQACSLHVIDLHWAISNRPLFANMFSFDELADDARPIKQLGKGAFTPAPVLALLFACIHRVAHHDDSHLLIWVFDIKMLAEGLSPAEWDLFWESAIRKRVVAVCRKSLAVTAALVGIDAEDLQRTIGFRAAMEATREPSAAYLGGAGSRWRSFALDLKAAPGAAGKLRFIAGYAFPDPKYMRNAYGVTNRFGLTKAYVRRAALGTWRAMT
jgi:hypothetical protein